MAINNLSAVALLALALVGAHTVEAARVLQPKQQQQQQRRRSLRLQQGSSASLGSSLSIDLHTRREGISGLCSQYVWMFVGPKPTADGPPAHGAYSFVLDPCFTGSSSKSKAAAASSKAVTVDYPPGAQSAGDADKPVAAVAADASSTTTIKVHVYDTSRLAGVQSGTGIACSWSQHEGATTYGQNAGGATAVYSCTSCGSVAVNHECSGGDKQGCAPVTVTCSFGPDATSCSGASCYGRK